MVKKMYPVKCAWCGRIVGMSEVNHSHSICSKCAKNLKKDYPLFEHWESMKTKEEK